MDKNKRYIKLESIGSAVDRHTLDLLPLNSDDTISFGDRCDIRDVTNTEIWSRLSGKDVVTLKEIASQMKGKAKRLELELNHHRN